MNSLPPDDLPQTLLSIRHLSVKYGYTTALDDIVLDLARGEIVGLVGENGAGKSTLLSAMAGRVKPSGGTMTLAGEGYAPDNSEEALAAGVGVITQKLEIDPELTVAEAVFRTSFRKDLAPDQKLIEAQELLDDYGLDVSASERISELHRAEQASVELLRLSGEETHLILLDEVSATFNDHEIALFHALAQRFAAEGRAVVHISHRLDEIHALSDRILVMRKGKISAELSPRDTKRRQLVAKIFDRDITERRRPRPSEATGEEVLRLDGVRSTRGISDVTMGVRRGEVLGITGMRRSGISDLAALLIGADEVAEGEMTLDGNPIRFHNADDAMEAGIGYLSDVDDELGFAPETRIADAMADSAKPQSPAGLTFAEESVRLRRVIDAVQRYGIHTTDIHQEMGSLSGGDQQKVALARWMNSECRILVLNHPTRGIDAAGRQDIYDYVDELCSGGRSVVLISSDLSELVGHCHRIAVMREKRLLDVYSNDDLTEDTIMMLALGSSWAEPQGSHH